MTICKKVIILICFYKNTLASIRKHFGLLGLLFYYFWLKIHTLYCLRYKKTTQHVIFSSNDLPNHYYFLNWVCLLGF